VTPSGRNDRKRVLMLALLGTACLISSARSAQATGCHVPERPVLAHTFSWERWERTGIPHTRVVPSPTAPAVHRLPCQGETPTLPSLAVTPLTPALVADWRIDAPTRGERVSIDSPTSIPSPFTSRVDRPPRQAGDDH
jgi:hypothetical protein